MSSAPSPFQFGAASGAAPPAFGGGFGGGAPAGGGGFSLGAAPKAAGSDGTEGRVVRKFKRPAGRGGR